MQDQILESIKIKHGIGEQKREVFRCHVCGKEFEDKQSLEIYLFPAGQEALFCDTDEMNSWKNQYKI